MRTPDWEKGVAAGNFNAMPDPFLWEESARLAHLVNGYDIAGSFEALSAFANGRTEQARLSGKWEGDALELWLCLFFEHRRWRHFGTKPEGEELQLLDRLCETLRHQLSRLSEGDRKKVIGHLRAGGRP